MTNKVIAQCSTCGTKLEMESGSLRRFTKKHGSEYVCNACINRLNSTRIIGDDERAQRSIRARELWNNQEYRDKVRVGVRQVASTDEFRKKVSDNNKQRWKNEDYRRKIDEAYRKRVLESKMDPPTKP